MGKKFNLSDTIYNLLSALIQLLVVVMLGIFVIVCYKLHQETTLYNVVDPVKKSLALDGWDWLALIVAIFSLIIGYITFRSQAKTERNTMKITPESQKQILIDYIRHYYRNLVIICAVETKLNKRFDKYYPSQEHLLKLKVSLDDLHPAAFYNHSEKYHAIHELVTKMRNFNTEIDVATIHLCDKNVSFEAKLRDFATLKFKMGYLAKETLNTIYALWNLDDNKGNAEQREKILSEVKKVLEKALESYNEKELEEAEEHMSKQEDKYPYFNVSTFYTETVFKSEEEKKHFLYYINCNIYAEMTAKNTNGFDNSEKIFLIPFN